MENILFLSKKEPILDELSLIIYAFSGGVKEKFAKIILPSGGTRDRIKTVIFYPGIFILPEPVYARKIWFFC